MFRGLGVQGFVGLGSRFGGFVGFQLTTLLI